MVVTTAPAHLDGNNTGRSLAITRRLFWSRQNLRNDPVQTRRDGMRVLDFDPTCLDDSGTETASKEVTDGGKTYCALIPGVLGLMYHTGYYPLLFFLLAVTFLPFRASDDLYLNSQRGSMQARAAAPALEETPAGTHARERMARLATSDPPTWILLSAGWSGTRASPHPQLCLGAEAGERAGMVTSISETLRLLVICV